MTTQEKIKEIEKSDFNNYNGSDWDSLRKMNKVIRRLKGDEEYLKYLKRIRGVVPPPIYQINDFSKSLNDKQECSECDKEQPHESDI